MITYSFNVERENFGLSGNKFENSMKNEFFAYENEFNGTKEKTHAFSGLFKKIMKEPDETEEELNNNTLADIFKYRQELQNNNFESTAVEDFLSANSKTFSNSNNENDNIDNSSSINVSDTNFKYDIGTVKTINDDVIDKKVSFGDTVISSDTKEIDVNVVNDFIKDVTTEMLSTKLAEKQTTQTINTEEVNSNIENFDKTQIIDLEEETLKQMIKIKLEKNTK